jgi:hypothetical protein
MRDLTFYRYGGDNLRRGHGEAVLLMPGYFAAFTSIHSRDDDVVDWRSCLDGGGNSYQVRGRHLGLIGDLEVYLPIAQIPGGRRDRLGIAASSSPPDCNASPLRARN